MTGITPLSAWAKAVERQTTVKANDSSTCDPNDEADSNEPDGDECTGKPDPAASNGVSSPDTTQKCILCGDPIDVSTGNLYEAEADYEGAGPFPLRLVRYYNSLSPLGPSAFGNNWSHPFGAYLAISSNQVQVVKADGKAITFTLSNNVWTSTANVNSKLTPVTSGTTTTGWQYTTGDDGLETYDTAGKLRSIVNRAGLAQNFTYDSQNRLTAVADPFGRTLRFTYDANNRISGATDPAGGVYAYAYDGNNNLVSVTYPDHTVRRYVYEDATHPHALTGLIDENGVRFTTWAYDSSGRAVLSQHIGGVDKTTLSYNPDINTTTVTDALGDVWTYYYTLGYGVGFPAYAKQPAAIGGVQQWGHDSNGNTSESVDYNGAHTYYSYDSARNLLTRQTDPVGNTTQIQWHAGFRLPTQITEPSGVAGVNRTTTLGYDSKGNLKTKTVTADSQSRAWSYSYNANGQITQIDGPRTDVSDVTQLTYDAQGNLSTMTDALGHVTTFTGYDANGRPLTLRDPNGLVTTLSYDQRGRLVTRAIGAETTVYTYDAAGNLTKVTQPDGSFLSYSYDPAHRLTGVTDALGNRLAYTLDLAGNHTQEQTLTASNAGARARSYAYDSANRLASATGAQNQTTTYAYDPNGNLTSVTDPLKNTATYRYDALNQRTRTTDPNGYTSSYSYDNARHLTGVTDPRSLSTQYTYDGLGNQTQTVSPDTGATTRTFDAAGNVVSSTDARGKATNYSYDALNRLTKASYADGTSTTWQYDQGANGVGRLTAMTDATGAIAWTYDAHGRVLNRAQTTGGVTLTTTYTYDTITGQLSSTRLPSGAVLSYQYDLNGQNQEIDVNGASLVRYITYEPFGPVALWNEGNDSVNLYYERDRDLDGNITEIVFGDLSANDNWGGQRILYTYDLAQRLTQRQNNDDLVTTYTYDPVGRVIDTLVGNNATHFAYDRNGNRTQVATATGTTDYTYGYGSNQLTGLSGQIPASLSLRSGTYTYDARGRLAQASVGSATTRFGVNGLGQRVSKSGTATTLFAYDEAGHLLGEYDSAGHPLQETVWLGDLPVGVLANGGRYYVNPGPLGTPYVITNVQGKEVWSWDPQGFGEESPNQNPAGFGLFVYNLRFPGQYYDAETGLHYNMARDYNPALGRYIQSDPIGLAGGINTYGYVGGNPVNSMDPAGGRAIDLKGIFDNIEFFFSWKENFDKVLKVFNAETDIAEAANNPCPKKLAKGLKSLAELGETVEPAEPVIDMADNLTSNDYSQNEINNNMNMGNSLAESSERINEMLKRNTENHPYSAGNMDSKPLPKKMKCFLFFCHLE